ncbi:MAG: Gfo/Idh/MocA family oxidoreductase [Myxococcales bacterium]|nr:Gfo/Idh/MocA family oxidoreductase [Myxococcales bacterium]
MRWTERRNLEAVLFAIATGRLDVKSLITHRFPFDRALDAYDLITGKVPEPHLGVVLTYPEAPVRAPLVRAAPRERSSSHVGIAMVGTGSFASGVLAPALKEISGARLVSTVSGRGLSARHVADKFGEGDVDANLDEVLARADVDAVIIATRHDSHAAQAAKALSQGRDVFLEKPAAVTEEQLEILKTEAERSSARLMIGFNRRFSPFGKQVRDAFTNRKSGLVMVARINAGRIPPSSWVHHPDEGGGRIIGEGCHFVDLMTYWAGALPVRVSAHAIGHDGGFGREDNVIATLTFADGSVGTLIYTAMGDPTVSKERYEVFCEGKVAILDNWRTLAVTSQGKTKTTRALRADKGHSAELQAFVDSCKRAAPTPMRWEEIEAVTRATFAIERARIDGVAVDV